MSCGNLHDPGVRCEDAGEAPAEVEGDGKGMGSGGGGGDGGGGGSERRVSTGSQVGGRNDESASTKRCPSCHVPIFKEGGLRYARQSCWYF